MRADGDLAGRIAALSGDDEPLFELLDDLSGRFALLVVEQGRARVFNDPIGSRSVFYNDGAPFAVSSHAFVLAAALGAAEVPGHRGLHGRGRSSGSARPTRCRGTAPSIGTFMR